MFEIIVDLSTSDQFRRNFPKDNGSKRPQKFTYKLELKSLMRTLWNHSIKIEIETQLSYYHAINSLDHMSEMRNQPTCSDPYTK